MEAVTTGRVTSAVGGKPNEPAWVKQNGQCSECIAVPAGGLDLRFCPPASFISLTPPTEQISSQDVPALRDVANEIDGASSDNRTAKLAIQAVKCLVALFNLIEISWSSGRKNTLYYMIGEEVGLFIDADQICESIF